MSRTATPDLIAPQKGTQKFQLGNGYLEPLNPPSAEAYEEHLFDGNESDEFIYLDDQDDDESLLPRQEPLHKPGVANSNPPPSPSAKKKVNTEAKVDDRLKELSHLASRVRLDEGADGSTGGAVRDKDKSDRSTVEGVLDPRTRVLLLGLVNRGVLERIDGCIATGKEANVYFAPAGSLPPTELTSVMPVRNQRISLPSHENAKSTANGLDIKTLNNISNYAVKVYKTGILSFKTRNKYVEGSRFEMSWNSVGTAWRQIKVWAEKEVRNYRRLESGHVPCPKPILLKGWVFVMEFLGSSEGEPAPRLEDLRSADEELWTELYIQTVSIMRRMYQVCRLVHADLSSYNLLYHNEKVHVIDVGQSVEQDHKKALEFLRVDIHNITEFFGRRGVEALKEPTVFEFVTADNTAKDFEGMHTAIEKLLADPPFVDVETEAVFRQQFIPQDLSQVHNFEQHANLPEKREGHDLIYSKFLADDYVSGEDESDEQSDEEGGVEFHSDDEVRSEKKPRGKKYEDKEAKKEHKQQVKLEKRKARENKIPKHVKKRAELEATRRKH